MTETLVRTVVVVAVVAVALATLGAWERRRPRMGRVGFAPGLVLVVGRTCSLCGAAVRRLQAQVAGLAVVDVTEAVGLGVRSVPTALVVGEDGTVLARRSGRAVLADAAVLATLSAEATGGRTRP